MADCLKIFLLGRTGHGKSSTGNSILMKDFFDVADDSESVTNETVLGSTECDGQELKVVDTPGLSDTRIGSEVEATRKIEEDLTTAMALCSSGVDCFLFVLSYANPRFTEEEHRTVTVLEKMFSREMFEKFCVVVFTRKDEFERKQRRSTSPISFDQWFRQQGGQLKELLELCQYRCVMFENMDPTEEQRKELVEQIRQMKPRGDRYTHELFDKAAESRQRLMEEKQYLAIKDGVLTKISCLAERLREIGDSPDDGDEAEQSEKLQVIKKEAEDLLQELKQYDNTSGVLNGIIREAEGVVVDVENKRSSREQAKKLQEENKRLQEEAAIADEKKRRERENATKGAAVGATAGIVLGPVGAVVGGLLGAALGSKKIRKKLKL